MTPKERTEVSKVTFPLVISESGLEMPAKWKITKKAHTMELYKHNNKGDHRHYHHGV